MSIDTEIRVSYSILVHNEDASLKKLLEQLIRIKSPLDEIVIVDDYSDNLETLKILTWAGEQGCQIFRHQLNRDFSEQKNFANSKCKNEYIFNIDADEYLDENLAKVLKEVINLNREVEVYKVPRINTVKNITLEHIAAWRWNVKKLDNFIEEKHLPNTSDEYKFYKVYGLIIEEKDDKVKFFTPIINFPDYQYRIYKNIPSIRWTGKVHEIITGYKKYGIFPSLPEYCIIHNKEIAKQEQQNKFYSEL